PAVIVWALLAADETLRPDTPPTRGLAPGESQVFHFDLQAGELVEAEVEQQGADVAVSLLDPSGTAALRVDSQPNPQRPERVLWIAETPGSYGLRVQSSPDRPAGRYRIRLSPPHAATPRDDDRVRAQRAFEAGFAKRRSASPQE